MTALASVKIEREKLLQLLREAKDEKLARFDEQVVKFNEKLTKLREETVKAASADLSKEANLKKLHDVLGTYFSSRSSRRYAYDEILGTYLGTEQRQQLEHRYDSAMRLVEISSDDQFKITSNTEFGHLLGL